MNIIKYFLFVFAIIFFTSCSKNIEKESLIKEKNLESQVYEAYEEGMKALNEGDVMFAAKKFNEAEILFPQSEWAPRSALMAAYSYYIHDYYANAIAELERFIKVYPNYKNLDYVYYLLAVSYYEQIVDEKKDLQSIINSKKFFEIILKNYPDTDYALDADFKINYINDILASKEMYIGRYYVERKKWIAAINRFRTVIDDYETTIYTEEALYRLVEVYYKLGLKEESKKYAKLLGYNYQSSEWYAQSYSLFDSSFKAIKLKNKKDNKDETSSLIQKIKSLID